MAGPFVLALKPLLVGFAGFLAKLLGNALFMGIFVILGELLPRLLGLGQGLFSWGFGLLASAAFEAFKLSLSMAGVSLPSFSDLLGGLPPELLWAGSILRVHKVVFIFVSALLVKVFRSVLEKVVAASTKTASSVLLAGGR